jgi:energy-coupling factor transport system permease protein
MVCAATLVLVTLVFPGWPAALIGGAVVLGAAVLARIPPTAIPRPPIWLWIFVLTTALLAFLGHGLQRYLQSILFTIVILGAAAIVTWTTSVSQIAPAVAALAAPLRKLRMPVDEWAVTIALCLRSLPLLIEEGRILIAARRLRHPPVRSKRWRPSRWRPRELRELVVEPVDLLTALLAVAIRRATELGQAITARGGLAHPPPARTRVARSDAVAFVVIAVTTATIAILSL